MGLGRPQPPTQVPHLSPTSFSPTQARRVTSTSLALRCGPWREGFCHRHTRLHPNSTTTLTRILSTRICSHSTITSAPHVSSHADSHIVRTPLRKRTLLDVISLTCNPTHTSKSPSVLQQSHVLLRSLQQSQHGWPHHLRLYTNSWYTKTISFIRTISKDFV